MGYIQVKVQHWRIQPTFFLGGGVLKCVEIFVDLFWENTCDENLFDLIWKYLGQISVDIFLAGG